jgi:hypothetical protein
MGRYLDPKNNTVFKSIFGKHPKLLCSFLNAIMPFEKKQYIKKLKYVQDPTGFGEYEGLVEAICKDNYGKKFIIEMDMEQKKPCEKRLLYIASNAIVRQNEEECLELTPVYGIAITNYIDENCNPEEEIPEYYFHYSLCQPVKIIIEGMHFVIIKLSKFDATNTTNTPKKKMRTLWLRFLKEINENCDIEPASELLENEYIRKAVELCKLEDNQEYL